jgi:2-amino-4-hydroxy-6-hydroxymethyldihydropteridine diphosphokinase
MALVLLGFGANLGDPVAAITAALERLEGAGLQILRRSSFYRTPPWGPVEQPPFINLCALAATALPPRDLLGITSAVEAELGRTRQLRWGPRLIDIDILAYDEIALDEPDLQIPHPRLTERAFVLVPLLEIAPDWPIRGRLVRDWAAAIDAAGIERLAAGSVTL